MGAAAMKQLALFAIALVSTFVAQAAQVAPRGGPEVTAAIEGAPSSDQTLVERLEPAAVPLVPDAPIKSNPLWSIPLSALSETRDRPLFNAARRPPPETIAAAPALDPSADNKSSELEGPPFALIGTILSPEARVALLLDQSTSRVTQLRQGKIDSGWTALSVGARSIVLRKGDALKTLNLPGPNVPSAAAIPSGENR
jgi:general secretion pathway protein N